MLPQRKEENRLVITREVLQHLYTRLHEDELPLGVLIIEKRNTGRAPPERMCLEVEVVEG